MAQSDDTNQHFDGEIPLQERSFDATFALNDIFAAHLAERYGWYATDESRADALDRAIQVTANALTTLLEEFPAEGPETDIKS